MCGLCILALSWSAAAGVPAAAARPSVDYNRDVRPILAEKCYACHGPDPKQRKAKLRLDVRAAALQEAIVPGKSAASPLVERIASTDPHEIMPPPVSKKGSLSPRQIDILKRWIDQGAKFDQHWAYVVPHRPAVPAVGGNGARNPIDRFLAAAYAAHGLKPATPADRITLLRRLYFDLVGLPPRPAEVDAFLNDTRPDAYERLVDRLLASPRYGERLAILWLDLVRYADTAGYHSDNHRDVWLYRDWVIRAFNTNMPFDRFTIEQLAGDLLPHPTADQRIASGYNRLLMTTEEGGAQPKEYRAKYAADRVRNLGEAWLGSTTGCCECHDHKYDPFKTRDFYRLAAFFADVQEKAVGRQDQTPIPTPEQAARLKNLGAELAALRARLTAATPELAVAQAAWEKQLRTPRPTWVIMSPRRVKSRKGATLTPQPDASVLASGAKPAQDVYTVTLTSDLPRLTGLRLEALRHPSLAGGRLSRANGNFVLTGIEVRTQSKDGPAESVKLAKALADYEQPGFPVADALHGDSTHGWAVEGHVKSADRQAVFLFASPVLAGPGTAVTVTLKFQSQYPAHAIGRFRLALTDQAHPGLGQPGLPADVVAALTIEAAQRTPPQRERLASYYREIAPLLVPVRKRIAELKAEEAALRQRMPTTLVTMAGPPRTVRILPRGNWLDDSGEIVTPDVPAFLVPLNLKDRRANRLDLAKWLVARDNPLVARVFVNRLWKLTFGQGLVKTMEDFGTQGDLPTHPELLDWLAVEFIESGWDVKHVLRLMVMSNAYRQSSATTPAMREQDPTNKWLARQGRFRLDAELVRDNALAVSGLLTDQLGGPSVKPYAPPGYWSYLNFPTREYVADKGAAQYRRGLYTYWCRTFAHPSLLAFDAPTREECTANRPRSSTPLQALALLNDPSYVEAARAFAAKALMEGGATTSDRLRWMYRRALSRLPRPAEERVLTGLLEKHRAQYRADPAAAKKLLAEGAAPVPKKLGAAELAAWTSVARVILNLHETITRN